MTPEERKKTLEALEETKWSGPPGEQRFRKHPSPDSLDLLRRCAKQVLALEESGLVEALKRAKHLLSNGIEMGYYAERGPESEALLFIEEALTAYQEANK